MRRVSVCLLCPLLIAAASPLPAQLASFDELAGCTSGSVAGALVPDGYAGLSWTGVDVRDGTALTGGPRNGVVSAPCIGYVESGQAEISGATPFTFDGGWFASGGASGLALFVTGYRNGTLAFSTILFLSTAETRALDLRWTELTSVRLASGGSEVRPQFVMDDLRFNGATSVVPEPATVWLLALGLAGVAVVTRRRHRS
jgi:hypothetical protein